MEWEIEYYKHVSMPLRGEQIFIVHRFKLADLKLPPGDLMIFDSQRAIVNSYNQSGLVIEADFYDKHDDLSELINLRNDVVRLAEPLTF